LSRSVKTVQRDCKKNLNQPSILFFFFFFFFHPSFLSRPVFFQIEMDQAQVKSEAHKGGVPVQLDTLPEELAAQIVQEVRKWALVDEE